MRKVELYWAENGWLLKSCEEGERDRYKVFSYDDTFEGDSEAKAFASFLYAIKEEMGPSESRYSKHRVMINIEPGDKFDDGSEEAEQ